MHIQGNKRDKEIFTYSAVPHGSENDDGDRTQKCCIGKLEVYKSVEL